jgi:putative lipoic acid-binding regulatory protein
MDRAAAIALLEAHHSFPSDHSFRVIVRADEADITTVTTSLAAHRGLPHLDGRCEQVPSNKGSYVSLRLSLPCASAEEVLDVYAHLGTIRCVVKFF